MSITIEDRRLLPILEKVQAGASLDYQDGLDLYRSSDILAIGYMANIVRERKHGNVTWFNVNRHINPTDVCVASCRLSDPWRAYRTRTTCSLPPMSAWQAASCARSVSAPRIRKPTPGRSKRSGIAPAKVGRKPSPSFTSWADCILNSRWIGIARCCAD